MAMSAAERQRRYRERHPERVAAAKAAAAEKQKVYAERWRRENRDKDAAKARRRREAHPEVARADAARRRARLAGATPDLTWEQWNAILEEFDHTCAYCQARGVSLEQEHVTPVSRGGRHTAANVVPACRSCNARKGKKTLLEFAAIS